MYEIYRCRAPGAHIYVSFDEAAKAPFETELFLRL